MRVRRRLATCVLAVAVTAGCEAPRSLAVPCEVRFDLVVTIGVDAAAHGPRLGSRLVRDASGAYYMTSTYEPGTVSVFDRDGRLLRTIGSRGDGPGEMQATRDIEIRGDTLFVNDDSRQILRFATDGTFLGRATPVTPLDAFTLLRTGGVATSRRLDYEGSGAIVVTLYDDGAPTGSFSPDNEATRTRDVGGVRLRDSGAASLWMAFDGRYLLQEWSLDGRLLRHLDRAESWYPPWAAVRADPMQWDSVARILDFIPAAGDALAIIMTRYANPMAQVRADEDANREPPDLLSLMLPVLHVVDAGTGELVAEYAGRDPWLAGFVDRDHVHAVRRLADGSYVFDVHRVSVAVPGAAGSAAAEVAPCRA